MFTLPEPCAEFCLAAALCRWPRTPAVLDAIRHAATAVTDWSLFWWLIKRHRIHGLAQQGGAAAAIALPSDIQGRLHTAAYNIARDNMHLATETARLQKAFDGNGIAMFLLKGPALGVRAYGSLTIKHSRDLDLLIAPSSIDAGWALLENLGYQLYSPAASISAIQRQRFCRFAREVAFRHRVTGLCVELGWSMSDNPWLMRDVDISQLPHDVITIAGYPIRTLKDDLLVSYLAVHGASHGWGRLKWLADFSAVLASIPPERLAEYRHKANALGADLCMAQGLLLLRRHLGWSSPDTQKTSKGHFQATYLARVASQGMVCPSVKAVVKNQPFSALRVHPYFFLLGLGWRAKFAHLLAVCIGPADFIHFPLPAGLGGLYPFLRLPFWVVRCVIRIAKRPHPVGEGARRPAIKGF